MSYEYEKYFGCNGILVRFRRTWFSFPPSRASSFERLVYFTHIKYSIWDSFAFSPPPDNDSHAHNYAQFVVLIDASIVTAALYVVQRALSRMLAHGKNTWCPWPTAVTFHRRYRLQIVPRRSRVRATVGRWIAFQWKTIDDASLEPRSRVLKPTLPSFNFTSPLSFVGLPRWSCLFKN